MPTYFQDLSQAIRGLRRRPGFLVGALVTLALGIGANVTVFRNDKISLEELIAKKPTQLVISPGPGHPNTDSGISRDAIQHFAGKIPIFGVCMGQ